MEHTFLFDEGLWRAAGWYQDETGTRQEVEGGTRIVHAPEGWVNDGEMTVRGKPPVTLRNRYVVQPLAPGRSDTTWTSENPALGRLNGVFVVVGDVILSRYESADGRHAGVEVLTQIAEHRYQNRGTLLRDGRRASSWSVDLVLASRGR